MVKTLPRVPLFKCFDFNLPHIHSKTNELYKVLKCTAIKTNQRNIVHEEPLRVLIGEEARTLLRATKLRWEKKNGQRYIIKTYFIKKSFW